MILLSLRGAVAAAAQTIQQPGTYEPVVAGLDPAVYLQFTEASGSFADSSGNGRVGTLQGTGAICGVSALAPNVGSSNKALDLGSAAWVEIAHAPADTALTTSYASPWDGDHTGNRFIADCTVSIWFKPNSLPSGSGKHVIVAKSSAQTPGVAASYAETHPISATAGAVVPGGSWEAYTDSNGAVHVEVRSFRGRPCRIRTPNGAVSAGTTYHLVVQLSYDGVAAWLNGAKFEDGYANLLHVYGLAANIRGIDFRNNYAWTIGRAAWGGQANLIVDEFAVFLRTPNDTISQTNVNTLAQKSSTPSPLAHHIWGQRSVNRSSFASIQAAVDNVNSLGGGTVLINAGIYNENVVLKSNVRIKGNGGTVTINGWVRTVDQSYAAITDNGTNFLVGDRELDVSNSRSVGDVVRVMATAGSPSPMRHDRRWNTTSESNDPAVPDGEPFLIESRTASAMTFTGIGSAYDFATADRQSIQAYTPVSWIAIEDVIVRRAGTSSSDAPVRLRGVVHVRLVRCHPNTLGAATRSLLIDRNSLYATCRECDPVGSTTTQAANFLFEMGCKDCVVKDCGVQEGSHALDVGGNLNFGPVLRIEFHQNTWDCTDGRSIIASRSAIGVHGPSTDNIYWNFSSNWGGPAITGWKHDGRWLVCGDPAVASSGNFEMNDGLADSYLRDIRVIRPLEWCGSGEGVTGVDRNHFANITYSLAPTGNTHENSYGTGANVNTYRNVDSPHASWQEV